MVLVGMGDQAEVSFDQEVLEFCLIRRRAAAAFQRRADVDTKSRIVVLHENNVAANLLLSAKNIDRYVFDFHRQFLPQYAKV